MKKKTKNVKKIFSFGGVPYMNERRYAKMESKKHLYFMKPDTYISKCSEILGMTVNQLVNTRLADHTSYRYIDDAADNGTLTIPLLDYKTKNQDGLHRAMWAKERGIKKIPVFIFK